jgi:ribosomal protein S9
MRVIAFVIATMATSAIAQEQPNIAGNYKSLATCVYRSLDQMAPGQFRMTDLGDEVDVTLQVSGGGLSIQAMKATFRKVSTNVTSIAVEGQSPGYYPSKVRPLANDCATRR